MKIALVSPYDFAYPGGVTTHISHLAQQFTRWGHSITIIAPSSKSGQSMGLDNFVHVGRPVPVPSGGSIARISLSIWLAWKVKRLLERENFDIIHVHEPFSPFVPISVLHYSNSLTVGTFHAYRVSSKLYWVASHLLQKNFARLNGKIAVSAVAREFVSKYFPGDYRIIPNGIDVEHFSAPREPLPQFCDGKVNILFVGRLEKRKGLNHLLGAYSRLKWDHPQTRLIVVGPGNLDREGYGIISARGLQDVVFTGGVSQEELPRYFHSSHIFCSPATGKESFGIVLLEAMAASKPIVASHIAGYATVMEHDKEGIFVPPKDEDAMAEALASLMKDPDRCNSLGEAGKMKAQRYSWEQVATEVMDYYHETQSSGRQKSSLSGSLLQ